MQQCKNLLFLVFLLMGKFVFGQQLLGGDISYLHTNNGEYKINLNLYRACADSAFPATQQVFCHINWDTTKLTLIRTKIEDLTPYCKGAVSPCNIPNTIGGSKGMELHSYSGNISIDTGAINTQLNNGKCLLYFEYKGNFRKGDYAITDDSTPLRIYALLDVCALKKCADTNTSNVTFRNPPYVYLTKNLPYYLNVGGDRNTNNL